MSKHKRNRKSDSASDILDPRLDSSLQSTNKKHSKFIGYLRQRLWLVGVIAVLSVGALGAGLKYLEEEAKRQNALKVADRSSLSSVNPFVVSPPPPTPQLSKELIYAGSRLLAVEDANANAAPPADLAVWRPSTGVWWVLGGPGSAQTTQPWGQAGDVAVPGDYDGDGKTDFTIWRPSTGAWWHVKSSDGSTATWTWGISGDIPAPGDYDGDGKTDSALFRPSNGTWYIFRSSDLVQTSTQYGQNGDAPAPADHDGDGRADLAVWRNSNTTFYSQNSGNGAFQTLAFSSSSTEPVSGDYDGDGRADYAIRNGSNWIIRNSASQTSQTSSTFQTVSWQLAADRPVQNDYDGDGRCDIATWRSAESSPGAGDGGTWYIRQSASNNSLRQVQWGMSGDIPVPAFYRR
ncbi:MAG: FG-GAP repeat domain-containing protein [Blastocatellia bacterium]